MEGVEVKMGYIISEIVALRILSLAHFGGYWFDGLI